MSDLDKYEREQFAELHKEFLIGIFCIALAINYLKVFTKTK